LGFDTIGKGDLGVLVVHEKRDIRKLLKACKAFLVDLHNIVGDKRISDIAGFDLCRKQPCLV